MKQRMRKVEFEGATGETLAARLDRPPGAPRAFAIFAHCFTCSKDVFAAQRISKALAAEGVAVLRFDFTGIGHSEGEFENTNFSSNVEDLVAAADFLREEYEAPSLLIGHSLGGAAVLLAGGAIEEVEAVSTINAPCHPSHVENLLGRAVDEIQAEGEAEVELAGRTFRIKRQFLKDLSNREMERHIGELDKPLMIFHGPRDKIVGIDNARRIFEAAKHPKSFITLDDADHLLSRHEDAEYVAEILSPWLRRHLPAQERKREVPADRYQDLKPEVVFVGETGSGKYQNEVIVGRHYMYSDEPEEVGGDNTGPSPFDYVIAGLGACTSMTLRMYAIRKDWPLENVDVRLRHSKVHAAECDHCEDKEGKVDRIERSISVEGDLDDEQRSRLLEIADKCPVHRMLKGEVDLQSELGEE